MTCHRCGCPLERKPRGFAPKYCARCRSKMIHERKMVLSDGAHRNHPRTIRKAGSRRILAEATELQQTQLERFLALLVHRLKAHPGAGRRARVGIIAHTLVEVGGHLGTGLNKAA